MIFFKNINWRAVGELASEVGVLLILFQGLLRFCLVVLCWCDEVGRRMAAGSLAPVALSTGPYSGRPSTVTRRGARSLPYMAFPPMLIFLLAMACL